MDKIDSPPEVQKHSCGENTLYVPFGKDPAPQDNTQFYNNYYGLKSQLHMRRIIKRHRIRVALLFLAAVLLSAATVYLVNRRGASTALIVLTMCYALSIVVNVICQAKTMYRMGVHILNLQNGIGVAAIEKNALNDLTGRLGAAKRILLNQVLALGVVCALLVIIS